MMFDLIYGVVTHVRRLKGDRRGATAIEYGLIVSLISIGILASVSTLGGRIGGVFNNTAACLTSAGACPFSH